MAGRFEISSRKGGSSRFRSSPPSSSRFRSSPPSSKAFGPGDDDFYAQQIFQNNNAFHDPSSPPPPPPSTMSPGGAPISYISYNGEDATSAAGSSLSPGAPPPKSPMMLRTPSAKTKNRYRDLSRKALPTERGRLKVLRAEQVRLEQEEERKRQEEAIQLQQQQQALRVKQQARELEATKTWSVLNQVLYWLTEQEFLHQEKKLRLEEEWLEEERAKQAELEQQRQLQERARLADQLLLVQDASRYIGWLYDQQQEQQRLAQAKRLKHERVAQAQRQAEQALVTRETTLIVAWLYDQQEVADRARRKRNAELAQQARLRQEQTRADQELLVATTTKVVSWLGRQEASILQAKQEQAKLVREFKLAEQDLLIQETCCLIVWIFHQELLREKEKKAALEVEAEQQAQRQQHEARLELHKLSERSLLVEQVSTLQLWLMEQEDAATQRRAKHQAVLVQQARAREATREKEQALVLVQAGQLLDWISKHEAECNARRVQVQSDMSQEEKKEEVGVETPPTSPEKAGPGAAGAVAVGAALTADAAKKKPLETPATEAATLSLASSPEDALMIPSASSSESGGNVSSLSSHSRRIASRTNVARPMVVGRRSQSMGAVMTVSAHGRVRSTSQRLMTRSNYETRRNASLRGMQSPGIMAAAAAPKAQEELWETASVSSVASSNNMTPVQEIPEPPVTVTVTKETKDTKAGIAFKRSEQQEGVICISKLSDEGLFANAGLKIGYEVVSINGAPIRGLTLKEAAMEIRKAVGQVVLVAQAPQGPAKTIQSVGPAWPAQDAGYQHAARAGVLWQTLVGQHVRFPKSWWNGARSPPMGVEDVLPTRDFLPTHMWKYIAVDRVERKELFPYVPEPTSQGRVLLHVVLRDETWKPVQDVAFGCYFPLDATDHEKDTRMVWMAIRKRSAHTPESTSLIDPILACECQINDIASNSPLGNDRRVKNDHLRAVFGEEPPERTLFILESELVKRLRNAMEDTVSSPQVSMMLLDLFLFKTAL